MHFVKIFKVDQLKMQINKIDLDFKLKSIHILEALNIYTVQKQEYGQLLMLFTIAEKF